MFQIVTIETGGLFNLAVDLMQLFSENTTYVDAWITSYTSLVSNPDPLPPFKEERERRRRLDSRLTPPFLSPSTFHPYLFLPFPRTFLSPFSLPLVTFLHCWMLLDYSFKSEMITLTSSLKRYDLLNQNQFFFVHTSFDCVSA